MADLSKLADILAASGKLCKETAQALAAALARAVGADDGQKKTADPGDVPTIPLDDPLPYDDRQDDGSDAYDPFERFDRTFFDERIPAKRPERPAGPAANSTVAARIAEMRRIPSRRENRFKSREEIFYLQAKYAENIEDDYSSHHDMRWDASNRELGQYFSGFSGMSVHSLRSYFTWRTKLRRGELTYGTLVFAFIYTTELINLIGVKTAEEAYFKLRDFMTEYAKLDQRMIPFIERWLRGMVVCYGLPRELFPPEKSRAAEAHYAIIDDPNGSSDDDLFASLNALSSYKPEASRMYKLYEHDFKAIVTRVFRQVRNTSDPETFREKYVGPKKRISYEPFSPALYFERNRISRSYELSDYCSYTYSRGRWYAERAAHTAENSAALGALIKNTDFLMRKYFKVKSTLKSDSLSEDEEKLIGSVIARYLKEKREAERPEVRLDLSKLSGIRASALETQNLLLVPQENEGENGDLGAADTAGSRNETHPQEEMKGLAARDNKTDTHAETAAGQTPQQNRASCGIDLTEAERLLLALLIDGKPYQKELLTAGVLPSVAADSINEKLMDVINDTAIIDNGEKLEIIEDYVDELKGILGKV